MRRIFAIAIVVFIAFWSIFWVAYAVVPGVQAAANGFFLNVAGPTGFNIVSSIYLAITDTVGILGLTGIILFAGCIVGIFVHKLWVSADWRIRRWGQARTARDLGTVGTTSMPSTPVGATTRPTVKADTPTLPEAGKEEPAKEETVEKA